MLDPRKQFEAELREQIAALIPQEALLQVGFVWQIAGTPESEALSPNMVDVRLIPRGPEEYNQYAAEVPGTGKVPEEVYNGVVTAFWRKYETVMVQLAKDIKGRIPERLRFSAAYGGFTNGYIIVDPPLTPVMARLDRTDLETLDALIAAGCAPNRADAIRWALARVRERPAYQKVVERVRELQELRSQL